MKKLSLEYIFRTSPKLLYQRISTASGLNEWFADNVAINKNKLTFTWNNNSQEAVITKDKHKYYVKLDWLDDEERYTEFLIEQNKITKDTVLSIIEMIDEDDEDFVTKLWDSTIKKLKQRLGLRIN